MIIKELRNKIELLKQSSKSQVAGLVIAASLAFFMAIYWDMSAPKANEIREPEPVETAATFIPDGYVLVPIEVSNFESLDSILGKFGVVDLYIPSEDPKVRPRKVAERVRILRAPLNPSRFAVLAKEADSSRLVSHTGQYFVVVQNPKKSGTGVVSDTSHEYAPKRRGSRITVEATDSPEPQVDNEGAPE